MLHKNAVWPFAAISALLLALNGCYRYQPPYNNFKPYHRMYKTTPPGALAGAVVLGVAGGPILAGTAIGGLLAAGKGFHKDSKRALIDDLEAHHIQYIAYGDTITLVVPTDRYFRFNSPHFNELCYPGLAGIIKLARMYCKCPIYVAGFMNDVGSAYHKRMLTQARAEAMITLLWANGIEAKSLHAEGYGDKYPVADNKLIHGSAQNRRLEIQMFNSCPFVPAPYLGYIK